MTRFADDLFDDLMREHGPKLAHTELTYTELTYTGPPAPRRHIATRRTLLAGGATCAAVAATAGALTAGGATPAFAVTTNHDGSVTVAVYQKSGVAGANARLRQLGDRVVVVPIEPGCPRPAPPVVSPKGREINTAIGRSSDGSVTVNAHGIPAGDIMIIGFQTTTTAHSRTGGGIAEITSPPAPTCISAPPAPPQP